MLIYTNLNHSNNVIGVYFSIQGLNKAISLFQEGENSNKCFIAMSFDSKMAETREIIKQVLKKTGYEPIIIDEEHLNSDQTINDAIIANLKKCKFCIADFSKHSNGVYFESGFALGQGKKVIYLCSDDEFKNTHLTLNLFNTLSISP
jgi:nucleoside 2-deoxyribosyltransferase